MPCLFAHVGYVMAGFTDSSYALRVVIDLASGRKTNMAKSGHLGQALITPSRISP